MIHDLFINACILISFISLSQIFYYKKYLSINIKYFSKIFIGLYCGLLGILLMTFSLKISSELIVDYRNIAIILSAIFGGFTSTILAAITIGMFRVFYFGISKPSLLALCAAIIIGLGLSVISHYKLEKKLKWLYSVIYSLVISTIAFIILINNLRLLLKVLTVYTISFIILSILVFYYAEYLWENLQFYKKLESDATVDFLTGLNNVRQFEASFNKFIEQAKRKEESLSLLFLDIDFFKKVNDIHGHSSGNLVLKELASIFINTCRSFDIISRNGGEEFSVLLLDCSILHAKEVAERIRKNVEKHKFYLSKKSYINITVSIGISSYPETTNDPNCLLEQADSALYEAKKNGKNKVVVFSKN